MRRDLPSGTVTFVFTDIAGSTKLLDELGEKRYAHELAQHRVALRTAFTRHEGVEVDTQGDAFFFAFPTATQALEATTEGAHALERGPIRVRMGVHTVPHIFRGTAMSAWMCIERAASPVLVMGARCSCQQRLPFSWTPTVSNFSTSVGTG
jgi:class 3 adenylate cyclase